MTAFVTAGAGFLFAVLWFDLMFDVQVLRHHDRGVPEDILVSVSDYYRRVTTAARPMNRLIGATMLATMVAIGIQIAQGDVPRWVGWTSLLLLVPPVVLASVHTLPSAVRLGARTDSIDRQSRRARSIGRDHLLCLAAITALLTVQLTFGR